jgi:cystathionine beta-lyase/cystathionine gamma-synthase
MTDESLSIYTLAVLAGCEAPTGGGAPAVPPLTPSVGFIHPTMEATDQALADDTAGYIYARHGGPTQAAFEETVASLEGAQAAVGFSSGMAALHAAILALVPPGGVIVAAEQLYGATRSLLEWLAASMRVTVHYADFLDLEATRQVITQSGPTVVICEVLTNPLVRVVRVDLIAEMAQSAEAALIVDNTFSTPFLLRPLEMGADLVVHSTTKFLNGHGDVLGGVVAGRTDLVQVARSHRKLLGAMPGAFESWLALRGLRTLAVRMSHACFSARQIAAWLDGQPGVGRVYYPGLEPDEQAHVAARALFRRNYFGAVMAFQIEGLDREGAFAFVERLKIIRPVTSLGDVNSLISHPATSSHRSLSPEERAAQGITEGTLRLSVGIEDPTDLMADLNQALGIIRD